jgi:hypothetical protein
LETISVLSAFPGDRERLSVERIGGTYVLSETAKQPPAHRRRGRPPYPWDRFHVEVAALLQRKELPVKKEAAIQYFQSWFAGELNVRPSRAVIGEKLVPYYERFIKARGRH